MPNEPQDESYEPYWSPLEDALGFEHCRDFMYMGSGTGTDDVPVYLYKHSVTRRYINLSDDGRAWQYDGDNSYTETDRTEAIREALTWVGYGEGITRFWEEELAKSDDDSSDSDNGQPRKPSPRLRKGVSKHDIFISYSHKDKDRVHGVSERLRDDHGILAWLDEWSILPGERISRSIESGLEEAKILFLMLSPNALTSQWVDLEWRTKFEEEVDKRLVAVVCVLIEPIDLSTLPPYLKGKKHITHDDDAILAQRIADAAKAHIERREELNNKAIGTGTADMIKKSLESNGGIALKPIYERVFNSSVFNHSNYSLRLRVLESELESALVVQQRRARTAKQHMDKMQEESNEESNAIPLFVATAAAIQSGRGLDAVEGFLIRVRNYGSIAKEDPDVAADLWKDALEFLNDTVENDAAAE